MARQRDYKAEYRARVARAKAQGLTLGQATGHAKRGKVELPSITELQNTGRLPKRRPRARVPQITDMSDQIADRTGTSRVVQSSSQRVLIAQIKAAAAKGQRVSFRGTFNTDQGIKTVHLGSAKRHRKLDSDGHPIGKVSMTVGADPSGSGNSYDAQDLLALLDQYGDLWDVFDHLIGEGEDWYG